MELIVDTQLNIMYTLRYYEKTQYKIKNPEILKTHQMNIKKPRRDYEAYKRDRYKEMTKKPSHHFNGKE